MRVNTPLTQPKPLDGVQAVSVDLTRAERKCHYHRLNQAVRHSNKELRIRESDLPTHRKVPVRSFVRDWRKQQSPHLGLAGDARQLRRHARLAVPVHRAGRRRPRDAASRRCCCRLRE